jgi:hypothetical protein
MKTNLITLLLFASLSSFAQITVKKGVIYEADKAILPLVGVITDHNRD